MNIYLENEKTFLDEIKSITPFDVKINTIDTNLKPNNMGALMNIEKLNEFNFLKEDVDKLGERAIVRIVKKGDLYIQLNF